jgi:hypothetical protein
MLCSSLCNQPVGVPKKPDDFDAQIAALPWRRRAFLNSLAWLWQRGYTPGDLVRGLGPVGRRLMGEKACSGQHSLVHVLAHVAPGMRVAS